MNVVLQIDPVTKQERKLPLSELNLAVDIFKKLKDVTIDMVGSTIGEKVFPLEADIEFSTEEKSFLLGMIKNTQWGVNDGIAVQEVIKKLS